VYQESRGARRTSSRRSIGSRGQLRGKIGESLKSVGRCAGAVAGDDVVARRAALVRGRPPCQRRRRRFPKATTLFEDAIAKDSGFAAAYVQLAYTLGNAGLQPGRQDSLITTAYRLRARLPERERYNVEGAYFGSRNDRPKAIAAYERAVAGDSSDIDAANALAILSEQTRNRPRAEQLYRRALVVEPENGIIFGTSSESSRHREVRRGGLGAARRAGAEDPLSDRPLGSGPAVHPRRDRLRRARARAGMKSTNAGLARSMTGCCARSVRCEGRLHESDSIAVELRARNVARGAPVSPIGIVARQALDDMWLRGPEPRAIARLDSAIRSNPLGPDAPAGQWLDAANTYAMAGAPDRARAIVSQYDAAGARLGRSAGVARTAPLRRRVDRAR
jgi:tetratricopeptide (TPR) repeat protein